MYALRKFHKNYYFKLWYLHCYYTETGFFISKIQIFLILYLTISVFFSTIMLHRSHTSFSPQFLCNSAGEMFTTAAGVCIIGTHVSCLHLYLHLPISRNATAVENRPYACFVQSHVSTAKIVSLLTHCHTPCKTF